MLNLNSLFDLSHSIAGGALGQLSSAHSAISELEGIIRELALSLDASDFEVHENNVFISKGARISDGVTIMPSTIICEGAELRTGALIRGNAIIGAGATIGNSCEVKNAIIFDEAQIPHFNYVGDSIIGYRAHLGAGVICSNLRSDKGSVPLRVDGEIIDTGLRKLGAFVGDGAEIGCNSVLCPGSVIGKGAIVYPLSLVRGFVKENSVFRG